ncbi:AraC family transcriptional regulator [Bacterioplanes sanyensis]|nr:AraC family transcriptional regulator [Bacterioplanes sanyensis]
MSTSLFAGFNSFVVELGADPLVLLERFNLPVDVETQKDGYVHFSQLARLFEFCAESLNCPDFALQLSRRQGLSILGPVAVLIRNANTIEEAIRGVRQYLHLISPSVSIELTLPANSSHIFAEFRVQETGLIKLRQIHELYLGNAQLILNILTGTDTHARCIHFPHSQIAPSDSYRRLFGCDIKFNQPHCAAELPVALLQQNIRGADPETAHIADQYLAERFGGRTDQIQDQVEHLIAKLLPTGHCRIDVVAEQLNLHPRTLQRRLRQQSDTHFDALLDAHRFTLAKRYLEQSTLPFSQIAGLLGYADQSALNRSCQRWFHTTPKALRQRKSSSQ